MIRIVFIFSILSSLLTNGFGEVSESKISEEQAKSIVLEKRTKNIGEVKIISVTHKGNEYIVKWENKENCEDGTDYVDDENGKITKGETTIC